MAWLHSPAGKLEDVPVPHQVETVDRKGGSYEIVVRVDTSVTIIDTYVVALLRCALCQREGIQVAEDMESVGLRAIYSSNSSYTSTRSR